MNTESMIHAIIIGDGCVDKRGRLLLHHSEKQSEWIFYKAALLEKSGFKVNKYENQHNSYGKMRNFIKCEVSLGKYGKELRELFYPNGKKIIPYGILDKMEFEELSLIFQDDGRQNQVSHYNSLIKKEKVRVECTPFVNRYEIATQGFDEESVRFFREYLLKLGIESSLLKTKNSGSITSISKAASKIVFYEGIKEFVIPSMQYKLSVKPTLSYHEILAVND